MEEGFDIYYYLDFCPNYIPEEGEAAVQEAGADVKSPRLKDILCTHWENIHLVHTEVDNVPHTIAELDSGTLTEAGKKAWADVLNAKVERVYQGLYGLQMELSGVKPGRLEAFSGMLGGYCSEQEYETWVNEPEREPVSPQPVSYTHLDVYKRQGIYFPSRPESMSVMSLISVACSVPNRI